MNAICSLEKHELTTSPVLLREAPSPTAPVMATVRQAGELEAVEAGYELLAATQGRLLRIGTA